MRGRDGREELEADASRGEAEAGWEAAVAVLAAAVVWLCLAGGAVPRLCISVRDVVWLYSFIRELSPEQISR